MKFLTIYIFILIFCIASCSNENSKPEDSAESQASEEKTEESYEDEETDENEFEDNVAEERSAPTASVSYNNQAPRIKTINIESISNDLRSGFRAVIVAQDPEGDGVDYIYQWKWNDTDLVGETDETLSWKDEFKKGDKIGIEVIPYDDFAQGVWRSEGSFIIPNSPPEILSRPRGSVDSGVFSYKVESTDPDGDNLTYSLSGEPEGMKISKDGEISWDYSVDDEGEYQIDITVSDGDGGESHQQLAITITP